MAGSQQVSRLATDVRTRRRQLGIRQQDLAGTSVQLVGALELGKQTVRLDKLVAVLDALGLELRADARSPSRAD